MSPKRGRMVPKKKQQQAPVEEEPEVLDAAIPLADVDEEVLAEQVRHRADPSIFTERHDEPDPNEPIVDTVERRTFEPTLATATEHVSEADLHDLMKQWRHGRATRNMLQAISDAYVVLLSVVMIGAMMINALIRAQGIVSTCSSGSCVSARTMMPWAMLAGSGALALAVSRLFGPVLASAAEGFWLMDAPIRRSKLLGSRLVLIVVVSGLVGAVLGALVATLTGSPLPAIGAWALATGLGTAGLVSLAAAEQGAERTWLVRVVQTVLAVVAVAALGVVVAIASGWLSLSISSEATVEIALVLAGLGGLLLVASLVIAMSRLNNIRRARLLSGGSLVSGMQGAMFALDFGLVRDILVEREAVARGHVTPTKGKGLGVQALIWRDVQRIGRFPKPLFGYVLTLVVPYAVTSLGLSVLNPLISALVLMTALIPFLGSLRVLSRTSGLMRALPFPTSTVRTAAMAVPGMLALLWCVLVTPAFMGLTGAAAQVSPPTALTEAFVTALAGWLAAVRWVSAKQINFNAPMVATGAGAMPPGMIGNIIRGFDIAVLVTGPLLLNISPIWSFVLAGISFIALRGTFNQEELRARQEEQQRELAKYKEQQAAAKKR